MPTTLSHTGEMALLAMKGNRFEEAVGLFTTALQQDPTASTWCGLALAKTTLVYRDQASFDEVLHCFRKAVACEPDQRPQIEAMAADAALRVMNDLAVYLQHGLEQARQQKRRRLLGGVATGLGATIGLSRRNTLFTHAVGFAGVAGGAATIFNASSQIDELRCGHARALVLYRSVLAGCGSFLTPGTEPDLRFQQEATALLARFPVLYGRAAHRGTRILALGVLGLVLPYLGLVFSIPATVMGLKDLRKVRNGRMDPSGRGRTRTGLGLGLAGLLITTLLLLGRA